MKIVVTGALGHIGSRLIRELPALFPGATISLIDNLLTQRYCSLFNLPADGKFQFTEGDILTADLNELFDGADAVVHLAAITDAANSFQAPALVEQTNYQGTIRVAEACAATGAPLLFLSTTSVYGTQQAIVSEDCTAEELKPQSPYAESKLKGEHFLSELAGRSSLKHVSLRFGTIFGTSPGMRFHTAVNKFIWQACMHQPITVWRTALDQRRPYLDLGDGVRALSFLIQNKIFDGRVYNVLTLNATVREIVDAIRTYIPDLSIQYVDTQIMNQLSYQVACERFSALGFTFRGRLETGVRETVAQLHKARGA